MLMSLVWSVTYILIYCRLLTTTLFFIFQVNLIRVCFFFLSLFSFLCSWSLPFVRLHRDLPQKPSAEVQACVSWLAHVVVGTQEQGSVISPWSLMTCLLLQAPITVLTVEGFPWHQLTEKTLWLKRLVLNYGVRLNWSGGLDWKWEILDNKYVTWPLDVAKSVHSGATWRLGLLKWFNRVMVIVCRTNLWFRCYVIVPDPAPLCGSEESRPRLPGQGKKWT